MFITQRVTVMFGMTIYEVCLSLQLIRLHEVFNYFSMAMGVVLWFLPSKASSSRTSSNKVPGHEIEYFHMTT